MPFVEAHSDTDTGALREAARQRNNALKEKAKLSKRYIAAKGTAETLLSAWDKNADAIKDGKWDVANTVIATAISLVMEAVLTDDPGDGDATTNAYVKELVEHLPAILTAINTGRKTAKLIDDLSAREAYLLSLRSVVDAMNYIISENEAAFKAYESKYDAYVVAMQNHDDGIIRIKNHSQSGNYNSVKALDLEVIKKMVKEQECV